MADLKIDIASVFSGKKAFQDAAKSTIGLNNQVKTLAKSYLGLFTAQRLGRAQFNAAKAFAADDKAAKVLSRSLDNLGLAYADPAVKNFIADLEKQFGVLDDQLRPAFQRLLTTTGDVAKSQSLLRTALDLAAASGQDVVTVAGDLSKGYVGQTRALAKYGLGLTQAELKAMKFEEVQAKINSLFGGQAAVAVDTYSGKFDRLNVSIANAQETLGKGFLDALSNIGGGDTKGFDNTINFIDTLSQKAAKFQSNFGVGIGQFLALLRGDLETFKSLGESTSKTTPFMGAIPSIQTELNKKAAWDRINQYKKENALQAKLLASKKAELKAAKEAEALKKAGTLFDIQQAGIIAALKGKITDEERTRLELQLAILTGNTSQASKLAGELAKSQGLTEALVKYYSGIPDAKNPFSGWIKTLLDAEAAAKRIADMSKETPKTNSSAATTLAAAVVKTGAASEAEYLKESGKAAREVLATAAAANIFQAIADQGLARNESQATINSSLRYTAMGQAAMGQTPVVNVTVQGSLVAQADLQKVITDAVTRANSSGTLSKFDRIPLGP
jgi:hypothetical protein